MGASRYAVGLLRLILPKPARRRLYYWYLSRRIESLPSRRYLTEMILPTLEEAGCRRILFVGVQSYNRHCLKFCRSRGITLWTIDIDPTVPSAGVPGHHIVGDVCVVDQLMPEMSVDATILNGVFGYGVDDEERANAALSAVAKVTKVNGIVIVGWNPGRLNNYFNVLNNTSGLRSTSIGKMASRTQFLPDHIQPDHHIYDVYAVVK